MVSDGPQGHTPLRTIRLEAGRTQEEVADEVGIDQSYLSLLEKGARVASPQVRDKLAAALEVPVEALSPVDAGVNGGDK